MNAITLNTFPSINSFTSPRAWFLAIIVLLHAGFVWMLSNGLTFEKVLDLPKPFVTTFKPAPPKPAPPQKNLDFKVPISQAYVPPAPPPPLDYEPDTAVEAVVAEPPTPTAATTEPPRAAPVMTEPEIDARIGLSEPIYPSADIRAGNAGTVLLSVLVLENGRIGEVRLDRSSGHARLDESAMREARRWRLKPGMRDGAPIATWKQIPVTFRLKEAVKM